MYTRARVCFLVTRCIMLYTYGGVRSLYCARPAIIAENLVGSRGEEVIPVKIGKRSGESYCANNRDGRTDSVSRRGTAAASVAPTAAGRASG